MVALNTAYASSETSTRSENRVGDFFVELPIASEMIAPQAATTSGKNEFATTILRVRCY